MNANLFQGVGMSWSLLRLAFEIGSVSPVVQTFTVGVHYLGLLYRQQRETGIPEMQCISFSGRQVPQTRCVTLCVHVSIR